MLKHATESDAGRYTCTARNEAGTASSTADIVVRRTQFPPVFGRRLQAQIVRPGSRVTMEVEVTGTPLPAVTWLKEDQPISDERIKIKAEGTRHCLIISKVVESDSGRYSVQASNRAGEALSIANLVVSHYTDIEQINESDAMQCTSIVTKQVKHELQSTSTLPIVAQDLVVEEKPKDSEPIDEQAPEVRQEETKIEPVEEETIVETNVISVAAQPSVPEEILAVIEAVTVSDLANGEVGLAEEIPLVPEEKTKVAIEQVTLDEIKEPIAEPNVEITAQEIVPAVAEDVTPVVIEEVTVEASKDVISEPILEISIEEIVPTVTEEVTQVVIEKVAVEASKVEEVIVEPNVEIAVDQVIPTVIEEVKIEANKEEAQPNVESAAEEIVPVVSEEMQIVICDQETNVDLDLTIANTETDVFEKVIPAVVEQETKIEANDADTIAEPVPIAVFDEQTKIEPTVTQITFVETVVESNISKDVPVLNKEAMDVILEIIQVQKHPLLKLDVTLKPADDIDGLVPEPPPEVAFAPKPESPPTRTREDFAEKARRLEEASKLFSPTEIPGGVRLLPFPVEESPKSTPQPQQQEEVITKRVEEVVVAKFDPFPDLEPFPFKPDPIRPKAEKPTPPRKPSRFMKGDSKESDYESDLESRIPPRWVPPGSDTEDSAYKKVKVRFSEERKKREESKEATPPSQFDQVPVLEGLARPVVLSELPTKSIEIIDSSESVTETKVTTVRSESKVKSEIITTTISPVVWPPIKAQTEEHFSRLPENIVSHVTEQKASQEPAPKVVIKAPSDSPVVEKALVPKRSEETKVSIKETFSSHPKPSLQALEMEKQWSHRFTTHSSKIWPPRPDEDRINLPWGKRTEEETEKKTEPSFVHSETDSRMKASSIEEHIISDVKPNVQLTQQTIPETQLSHLKTVNLQVVELDSREQTSVIQLKDLIETGVVQNVPPSPIYDEDNDVSLEPPPFIEQEPIIVDDIDSSLRQIEQQIVQEEPKPTLEPFPFKPEPVKPKKKRGIHFLLSQPSSLRENSKRAIMKVI